MVFLQGVRFGFGGGAQGGQARAAASGLRGPPDHHRQPAGGGGRAPAGRARGAEGARRVAVLRRARAGAAQRGAPHRACCLLTL